MRISMISMLRITLLLCLCLPVSGFATINVSVDRTPLVLHESFRVFFETSDSVGDPDFSSLRKDFDILSTGQSSSTTMINGQIKRSKKWVLDVFAKRHGQLIIPAIQFGKEYSQLMTIQVHAAKQSTPQQGIGDIFLEAVATPKTPYVQQQVLLTVRLFRAVHMSNDHLSEPTVEGAAVIKKLVSNRQYNATRNNRQYIVYEQRYAIFPQASGAFKIGQLTFQRERGTGSVFNRSMNQRLVTRSDEIVLQVQNAPTAYQGKKWLPAQKVTLVESWSESSSGVASNFYVGEPITRTITLRAEGVTGSHIPELQTQFNTTNAFKQYPDQPSLQDQLSNQGVNGVRIEKIAIISSKAGKYTLEAIVIPWWNTRTNQQEYASLPEKTISIATSHAMLDKANVVGSGGALQPYNDDSDLIPTVNEQIDSRLSGDVMLWRFLAIIFAVIWLITCALWFYFRCSKPIVEKPIRLHDTLSFRKAMRRLKVACTGNDLVLLKDALLFWDSCLYPDTPAISLDQVSKRYSGALATEIERISSLLYGREKQDWSGLSLWNAIHALEKIQKTPKEQISVLKPLHDL